MERSKVVSSQIESIGYKTDARLLEIEFKKGGLFQYENVGPEIFRELMSAESIGSFFIHNIKKKPELFPFKRIERQDTSGAHDVSIKDEKTQIQSAANHF